MKKAGSNRNKLEEWEREKNYQEHLYRIQSITSQNRARKKEGRRRNASQLELPLIRNYSKNDNREVTLENERIGRKLREIGRRKSQFVKQTREEKNYYTINMKSREMSRKQQIEHIQQENDLIVERILRKRSGSKILLQSPTPEGYSSPLGRSRKKKRNSSVLLRSMEKNFSEDGVKSP